MLYNTEVSPGLISKAHPLNLYVSYTSRALSSFQGVNAVKSTGWPDIATEVTNTFSSPVIGLAKW